MTVATRPETDSAGFSSSRAGYMPQLDTLRTFAVFAVIVSHWFEPAMSRIFPFGNAGVTLFFVLSGFLISQILLAARKQAEAAGDNAWQALGHFYARRSLRIFPAYFLTLLLYLASPAVDFRGQFGWYALYGVNFLLYESQSWTWPAIHLWTLAVEEQFYLVWPLLLLFAPLRHLRTAMLVAVACGPLTRFLAFRLGAGDATAGDMAHVLMPSCMDSFGLGALLAFQRVFVDPAFLPRSRAWHAFVACNLVSAVLCRYFWEMPGLLLFRLNLSVIALALIARASLGFGGAGRRLMENPVLVYLGGISYGLYLFHLFIPELYAWLGLGRMLPAPLAAPVQLALLVLLAACSWHLVERPINQLKARFRRSDRETHGSPPRAPAPAP